MEGESANPQSPSADPGPAPSPWSLVIRVFYEPSLVFEQLIQRPRWGLPVVLLAIIVVVSVFAVTPKVDVEGSVREALEKRLAASGRQVTDSMVEQQVKLSESFSRFLPPITAVMTVVLFLFTVLLMWAVAKAFGAEVSYQQTAAAWAHANLPNLLGALISLPLFLSLANGSIRQQEIPYFFKSNLGALLSSDTASALRAFAGSLDVFALWSLALLVIAFRKFPGLSRASATGAPIGMWVIYVLAKTGWNAVFG